MLSLATPCRAWLLVVNVALVLTETHATPLRTSPEGFLQAHGRVHGLDGLKSRAALWGNSVLGPSKPSDHKVQMTGQQKDDPVGDMDDEEEEQMGAAPDALDLSSLHKSEGLVDIYTNPLDRQVLLFNMTNLIKNSTHVLVTASWSRGTFTDDEGLNTILHEPVDDTDVTMLRFHYSRDGSVDVIQPRVSLRTSDKQARAALNAGAWPGWVDTLKVLPVDGNDTSIIVDGTSFLGNGFYAQGWTLLKSIVDFRVQSVKSYPQNILVTCAMQLESEEGGKVPVQIAFSLVALPSSPMPARPSDDRLGYFTVEYMDVGQHPPEDPHQLSAAVDRETSVIQRFDLNSEGGARKEIRFYIDPTVPQRWRRYFKEGVEAWNEAFALAGRPHTMHAVMPTDKDWPEDYDRDDARYSTISWSIDVDDTYALGLAKVDPRSGQILKSDIIVTNGWVYSWLDTVEVEAPEIVQRKDTMNTYRIEQRRQREPRGRHGPAQASRKRGGHTSNHSDPSARRPLLNRQAFADDDKWEKVVGAGLRSVVMHETGHSLGLRHNFKGSIGIGKDCLSDKNCTARRGVSVSVMDYMPINIYAVGQPEESRPDLFQAVVGEYDKRAIQYGYTEVPRVNRSNRTGSLDFSPGLKKILEDSEWLPACTDEDLEEGNDPSCKQHDLSSNPVEYQRAMLDVLAKEAKSLLNTSVLPGQSYTRFGEAFEGIVGEVAWIGSELMDWLGGLDTNAVHRQESGEHSALRGVGIVPYQTQLDALKTVTDIIHQEFSILPKEGDLQFLLSRVGDIGVRAIDMQETVRRLQLRLVNGMTTPEMLLRVRKASSINASSLNVTSYLHELTDRLLFAQHVGRSSSGWDVQATYFRNLKKLYFGPCKDGNAEEDHYMMLPMEIVTNARMQLKRAERTFMEQSQMAFSVADDQEDAVETERTSFLMHMKAELSDLDQPCSAHLS